MEMAKARLADVEKGLRSGWKWEGGYLVKGHVHARPRSRMPLKMPSDKGFDPRKDAFAIRMGATYIEDGSWKGRYRLGEHVVDHLGAICEDGTCCPGCGSRTTDREFRFMVRIPGRASKAEPWREALTYCRVCCTPAEIEQLRHEAEAARTGTASKGGRR